MSSIIAKSTLLIVLLLLPFSVEAEDTIQQQIDQAAPGSTIYIEEGHYEETLVISKPLTIIGDGNVVFYHHSKNPVITINDTEKVEIHNIDLEHKQTNTESLGMKISDSPNITLRDMSVQHFYTGIELSNVKNSDIEGVRINGQKGHFSKKSNGINLFDTYKISIANSIINSVRDGIYIENDQDSSINDNKISDSRYGVHLMYSDGTQVEANTLKHNVTGIMHMMASNTSLISNTIEYHTDYNGYGMVLFEGEHILIERNKLLSNRVGISLQKISDSNITENIIAAHQTGLQFIKYSSTNVLSKNDVYGNILSVASDKDGAIVKGNFFDDYNGFDLDSDDLGDTPYQSSDSYARLMVKQNAFQFFFESPSVVALSKVEKKLPIKEQSVVMDEEPSVQRTKNKFDQHFNFFPFLLGSLFLVGGLLSWTKCYY